MKKLKLINLSKKPSIANDAMAKLRGGNACCCGCCAGSLYTSENYTANANNGYTCSCGNTTYGVH
jgi:natural product precursor